MRTRSGPTVSRSPCLEKRSATCQNALGRHRGRDPRRWNGTDSHLPGLHLVTDFVPAGRTTAKVCRPPESLWAPADSAHRGRRGPSVPCGRPSAAARVAVGTRWPVPFPPHSESSGASIALLLGRPPQPKSRPAWQRAFATGPPSSLGGALPSHSESSGASIALLLGRPPQPKSRPAWQGPFATGPPCSSSLGGVLPSHSEGSGASIALLLGRPPQPKSRPAWQGPFATGPPSSSSLGGVLPSRGEGWNFFCFS